MKTAAPIEWTEADCLEAEAEGWNLFNIDTHPEIQRDDSAGIFSTDEEAEAFVKANALHSLHCTKALRIVSDFSHP